MHFQKTTEQFIHECLIIHGDKYNYEKTNYTGCMSKIIVTCKKHGDFLITPNNHLRGRNCPKCGQDARNEKKRLNIDDLLIFLKEKYNDKYDYSKMNYKSVDQPFEVICPIHGSFFIRLHPHLHGLECLNCVKPNDGIYSKYKTEDFVLKAKQIHGDAFDYTKTIINGMLEKCIITCKKHGDFYQVASAHLSGKNGCKKCNETTKEIFLEKCYKKYGDKYDYSKTIYKNNHSKITILCKKHGAFITNANRHLLSGECPSCRKELNCSVGEMRIKNYLDMHNIFYQMNKKFEDCKYKKCLPFDFYLPELNILIEFDGAQHFTGWWKDSLYKERDHKKEFSDMKIRDSIKNDYCENKNIPLLRISYTDMHKIEKILDEKLIDFIKTKV